MQPVGLFDPQSSVEHIEYGSGPLFRLRSPLLEPTMSLPAFFWQGHSANQQSLLMRHLTEHGYTPEFDFELLPGTSELARYNKDYTDHYLGHCRLSFIVGLSQDQAGAAGPKWEVRNVCLVSSVGSISVDTFAGAPGIQREGLGQAPSAEAFAGPVNPGAGMAMARIQSQAGRSGAEPGHLGNDRRALARQPALPVSAPYERRTRPGPASASTSIPRLSGGRAAAHPYKPSSKGSSTAEALGSASSSLAASGRLSNAEFSFETAPRRSGPAEASTSSSATTAQSGVTVKRKQGGQRIYVLTNSEHKKLVEKGKLKSGLSTLIARVCLYLEEQGRQFDDSLTQPTDEHPYSELSYIIFKVAADREDVWRTVSAFRFVLGNKSIASYKDHGLKQGPHISVLLRAKHVLSGSESRNEPPVVIKKLLQFIEEQKLTWAGLLPNGADSDLTQFGNVVQQAIDNKRVSSEVFDTLKRAFGIDILSAWRLGQRVVV